MELDSTFAIAYLLLAEVQSYLGNSIASKEAYEKAHTFSWKATEKDRLRIDATYSRIIEKDRKKQFDILNQMAKRFPREKRVHADLGYYYRFQRNPDQALAAFNKAVELDPNWGEALNQIGYIYSAKEDFRKAIEYFERYASASPGDPNPFDSIGETHFRIGSLEKALGKFQEAVEVKPNFYSSYVSFAYIFALQENYPKVFQSIDKLIEIAPSQYIKNEGLLWKAYYNYWLGRLGESLKVLDFAAELHEKGKVEGEWLRGFIYCDKYEFDLSRNSFKSHYKAWAEFSSPKALSNVKAKYSFSLGLLDLQQGTRDSAKSRLTEMNSQLAEIGTGTRNLRQLQYELLQGNILAIDGSFEKAIEVYQKTTYLEITRINYQAIVDNDIHLLEDGLARTYQKIGNLDKAILEYEQLTSDDPNMRGRRLIYPKHHFSLAKLYEAKGMRSKAIERYKKFLDIWNDADEDFLELDDAKNRLATLLRDSRQ